VILVDTSVLIELLNGRLKTRVVEEHLLRFVTCGPIAQEILQGSLQGAFADGFREAFLAISRLCDPLRWDTFMEAAEIYRQGRKSGYTIRSSIDGLIAAVAIENHVPVWHRDRDFSFIARYTRLQAFDRL